MEKMLEEIGQANAASLDGILKAVLRRYAELFPSWEVIFISLEKNTQRNVQINRIIEILEKIDAIT